MIIVKIRIQVSELEDELQTLIRSSKTTVKNLEDFIKNNAKDLHTKHYLNLMGKLKIIYFSKIMY